MSDKELMRRMLVQETERTKLCIELRSRVAELEAAIDKLAACKGRYHPEANFKELIAVREKGLRK